MLIIVAVGLILAIAGYSICKTGKIDEQSKEEIEEVVELAEDISER